MIGFRSSLIEEVFTPEQKQQIIHKLTDAMVEGRLRPYVA